MMTTLLHNMSVPAKTVIKHGAPADRVYGHGLIVALPENFRRMSPSELLAELGCTPRRQATADHALRLLIDARALALPLPPVVAVTSQSRKGDTECIDLLTRITILAKSSSRVYLRDKEPNLASIVAGRRIVLLLPRKEEL